ncbi:MAG: glucosaminidase domain-containing protein [Spirochaetota bacterium]
MIDRPSGRLGRLLMSLTARTAVVAVLTLLVSTSGAARADARVEVPEKDAGHGDLPLAATRIVGYAEVHAHIGTKNPSIDEIYLRTLYRHYLELCRLEGVNMAVAIAQMIHETDYLRFTGAVRAVQYNYAGLGATGGGNPGLSFADMRSGVAAHVQHIKAYANDEPLETRLVDPRFHLVRRGSAPTVRTLTGQWATDPEYDEKLSAHLTALLRNSAEVGAAATGR